MVTVLKPSVQGIWDWLGDVPDPEIPVISVVELGVVRDVTWRDDVLHIAITPTYSGCPATTIIALDIETALAKRGVNSVKIETVLSPAWSTDWIAPAALKKLQDYGIAPPSPSGGPDQCPICHSPAVERISQFGSTPCKAQWRCTDCLEPFDYFKCH